MKQKQIYSTPCCEEIALAMPNAIMEGSFNTQNTPIEPDDGGESNIL